LTINPLKVRAPTNELQLRRVIHHWNYLFEGYKILHSHLKKRLDLKIYMNIQSFGTIKVPILGLPLGSLEKKYHLDVVPVERHTLYYKEGSATSSQRL
jgi:hypothetical protein